MSLAEPCAITTATRDPVGHHSGTPSIAETLSTPLAGLASGIVNGSNLGVCSTTASLRGEVFIGFRVDYETQLRWLAADL
jgi:hypothetical protein